MELFQLMVVLLEEQYHLFMEVKHQDNDLSGQQGILLIGVCSVFLIEEDRVVTVQSSNLEPILPPTKDMFKVLSGEQRDLMRKSYQ